MLHTSDMMKTIFQIPTQQDRPFSISFYSYPEVTTKKEEKVPFFMLYSYQNDRQNDRHPSLWTVDVPPVPVPSLHHASPASPTPTVTTGSAVTRVRRPGAEHDAESLDLSVHPSDPSVIPR